MAKLFVGQIPKTMEEEDIRAVMAEYGEVKDIKIIRDKLSGAHRGCCFVTYDTQHQASIAINALHNVKILGNLSTPMQVKYAEGESNMPHKLFVGMLTKTTTEQDLTTIFVPFGEIEEVTILRGQNNVGKGCGFVRYKSRESALKAISALNGAYKLEGASGNIIVKFADTDKFKQQKKQQQQAVVPAGRGQQAGHLMGMGMGSMGMGMGVGMGMTPSPLAPLGLPLPPIAPLDPSALAALYQTNPLLANIASNPLAATLLPTIAAALGIPSGLPTPSPVPLQHPSPGTSNPSPTFYPPPSYISNPPYYHSSPPAYTPPTQQPETQLNAPQREGPAGCNLFIYHLPQEYNDATLSQLFAPYGNVLSAKVFVDKATMQSKCFGFVSYDKAESASAAIAGLHGQQLMHKRLKVSLKKADSRPAPY